MKRIPVFCVHRVIAVVNCRDEKTGREKETREGRKQQNAVLGQLALTYWTCEQKTLNLSNDFPFVCF